VTSNDVKFDVKATVLYSSIGMILYFQIKHECEQEN